jgi:hypothetical protein
MSKLTKKENILRFQWHVKKQFRETILENIGVDIDSDNKNLRVCNLHTIEKIDTEVKWITTKDIEEKTKVMFYLPSKTLLNIESQREREKREALEVFMKEMEERADKFARQHNIRNRNRVLPLFKQKMQEAFDPSSEEERLQSPLNKMKIRKVNIFKKKEETAVRLSHLNDKIVKIYTGFDTLLQMLSYIAVICDGNIEIMTKTTTKLSWLEEWLVFYMKLWGKNTQRWVDLHVKFGVGEHTLQRIFDIKLKMHKEKRDKWPKYATFNEDRALRKEHWNDYYDGFRVVMWDNTNIPMFKSGDANNQRLTYSAYYAGNVAKGGVFVQLCGWMGTHELYPGAITDSEYILKSKILEEQHEFIQIHDKEYEHFKWTNILDKGFRVTANAWLVGEQLVLQPIFASSDRQFSGFDVLLSAAVASHRWGNERAVRLAKIPNYVKYGLRQNERTDRLADAWEVCGFQSNFKNESVL